MKIIVLLLVFSSIISCKKEEDKQLKSITSVTVEDIYTDSTLSIRAIELLNDNSLAFAANNGTFGLYNPKTNRWMTSVQKVDSLNLQFRAVAHTSTDFFMLSVENPALLFKTGDDGMMELVYKEVHDKVFYDAMTFWNDLEGIAVGDPTDECMSIIITRDGGNSWNKLPCSQLPAANEGEAAFAASNTNIAAVDNHTWIATGGKSSRILYSLDKGETWEVFQTPIVQGEATTGIYSIDFYDDKHGFAIGGDYTKPESGVSNKIVTSNGGKTWTLVADAKEPGYRSCVQYVPNSNAQSLVVVGPTGIDVSNDKGNSWKHLSDESFHTLRFLNDSVAYAAGNGRISKLVIK